MMFVFILPKLVEIDPVFVSIFPELDEILDVFVFILPKLVEIDPVFKFINCELSKKPFSI